MPKMYCGNNRRDPSLRNGSAVIGTPYGCMLKGRQIGLSQPADPKFLEPYEPIDERKCYCGEKARLPRGYSHVGKLYECMLKGIGWGKREKAEQAAGRRSRSKSKSGKKSKKKSKRNNRKVKKSKKSKRSKRSVRR